MQGQSEFVAGQRTEASRKFAKARALVMRKAQKYSRLAHKSASALQEGIKRDPQLKVIHQINQRFTENTRLHAKELLPIDVTQMELLQQLLIMYHNDEFIGTRVMPEIDTRSQLNGNYWEMDRENRTAYPDDQVGHGGRVEPNELSQSRTQREYNLKTYSYKEFLEWHTVQNQAAPFDEVMDALFNVLYGLQFKQEDRIAGVVFDASNYGTANKVTLAATDRFEDSQGDPMGVVDDAKASIWGGGGAGRLVLVCGRSVFKSLKFHNQLLHRVVGGSGMTNPAMLNQQAIAELLEVDELLVGAARKNTGTDASPTFARMWTTTSMALVRVADNPSPKTAAFGYTFSAYPIKNQMFWQPESGAAGVYMARGTMAYAAKVVAADTSYHVTTATSS